MNIAKLTLITATALLLGSAGGAFAQGTANTTMAVSATVASACTVAATPLAFGPINVLSAAANGTATVTTTCSAAAPYTILLSAGLGAGASITDRIMTGTPITNVLHYTLSPNVAQSINWGIDAATDVNDIGTGSAQPHTVFGQVAAQSTVPVGVYGDTITVTVNF